MQPVSFELCIFASHFMCNASVIDFYFFFLLTNVRSYCCRLGFIEPELIILTLIEPRKIDSLPHLLIFYHNNLYRQSSIFQILSENVLLRSTKENAS